MNQSWRKTSPPFEREALFRPRQWRVVLADDDALPTELLKRMLMRLGHSVVGSAQNGSEALALVRELRPDVVLMDLRMPVMDGWSAMTELARDLISPVVVVSALDDREALEQAAAAGASAFLTKPVREDELDRALALAVARFADMQEIRKWRAAAEQRARAQAAQAEELARVLRELRAAQLQLVTAARRAAIASLARSLTHEINNALTPIIGSAQMIRMLHPQDAETLERTHQIVEHANRIAGWTAAFRQIAVSQRRERISFSFNGIVRDVLDLYAERLAHLGIVVSTALDEQLPPMQGYPDQLQEMWINLIQNAVEAMRAGGSLHFRTEYVAAQDMVIATLSDSGVGIAAEDLVHVVEPGFSAKRVSDEDNSLDWGLFTANEIVKAHQGTLAISSPAEQSSHGMTVRMRIPLHSKMDA
jgi:signal transduction histidine kinase